MESCCFKIVLCFFYLNIFCADSKITPAQREYLSVFKNIPRLFEYLLETLDERPEILEKNNANVFKRSIDSNVDSANNDVELSEELSERETKDYFPDQNKSLEQDNNFIEEDHSAENKLAQNETKAENTIEDDDKPELEDQVDLKSSYVNLLLVNLISEDVNNPEDISTESEANFLSLGNLGLDSNANGDTLRELYEWNDQSRKLRAASEEKFEEESILVEPNVDSSEGEGLYDLQEWIGQDFFVEVSRISKLSAEEITERAIEVEKMLEEHNNRK